MSSAQIEVSWENVPAIDENGIIIFYEVMYKPLHTFGGFLVTEKVNTTGPVLTMNIDSLEEYVEHNISVRTYTSVGPGPYSDPVTERTLEDGELPQWHITKLLSVLSAEPDGAPQNVTAIDISSTEVEVSWEKVPAIDENGIITVYEVQYEPLQTFGDQISTNTTNTTYLNKTLTGLQEYVEYNISVRAYTSVGPGPYSDPVIERTLEDG